MLFKALTTCLLGLGTAVHAAEITWDDGRGGTLTAAPGGGDADQNWSTATNWRFDNTGTVPPNDTLAGALDRANIAFDSGADLGDITVTTIAAMPGAAAGGAVLINGGDTITVNAVRVGTNPGLSYGGSGRLENNGGTLTVDNSGGGTGNHIILGNDGNRAGTYIQTAGTLEMDGTASRVYVGNSNGEGFLGLIGGTINADAGGFIIANSGTSHGSFVMDGGTLNVAGGNFETANAGVGVATLNAGTYNQTTNNLIVGQASSSTATFNANGATIDLENQLRISNNAATGTFNMTAGTVNVGTTFAMSDHGGGGASTSTANISGGTLNISDRAGGGWLIGSTNNAASSADVTVSGTADVNVLRSGIRIADRGANSVGTLTQDGGTIDVNGGNTEVADNGTGTLTINGGTFNQNTSNIIVGQEGTSNATMTVNGGTVDIQNQLRIANRGTGLYEQTGGVVNVGTILDLANNAAADSDATVRLSGGNLNVGDRANSDLIIGNENRSTSTSTVEVSGGFLRVSDEIRVAQNGADSSGTLNISGGTVDARSHVFIGVNGDGVANISGGTLNVAADLPTAAPSDFSAVTNTANTGADLYLGFNAGSTGVINQSGGTVNVLQDGLFIGNIGTGTYNLTDGALDIASGALIIGNNVAGVGTLNVGTLDGTTTPTVSVSGNNTQASNGTGTLNIYSGTFTQVTNNLVTGQSASSVMNMQVGGGSATATFDSAGVADWNVNSGDGNVDILTNGVVNVARNMNLGNGAAGRLDLDIIGGELHVGSVSGGDLNYRAGGTGVDHIKVTDALFDVGRDMNFNDGAGIFEVNGSGSTLDVGRNYNQGSGNNHVVNLDSLGISHIDAANNATLAAGSIVTYDDSGIGALSTTASTTLSTATVWDASDTGWTDRNPDGSTGYGVGDRIVLVEAAGTLTDSGVTGVDVSGSGDWTLASDATSLYLEATTAVSTGPVHATLDNDSTTTRATSLNIAATAGADATGLAITSADTLSLGGGATLMVSDGAKLSGEGTVTGGATVIGSGGTLDLGSTVTGLVGGASDIGSMTFEDLELASGTALFGVNAALGTVPGAMLLSPAEIGALIPTGIDPTSEHDGAFVTDTLTLSADSTIRLLNTGGTTFMKGDYFDLFDFASLTGITAADIPGIFDFSGLGLGGLGVDYSLFASEGIIFLVPEPSRAILLLAGSLLVILRRRR